MLLQNTSFCKWFDVIARLDVKLCAVYAVKLDLIVPRDVESVMVSRANMKPIAFPDDSDT